MKDFLLKILSDKKIIGSQLLVLREPDNKRTGSDIDVMVPIDIQKKEACYKFLEHIRQKNWRVISYRELDYLISIIIVNSIEYPEEAIKIDFFGDIGWLGVSNNGFDYSSSGIHGNKLNSLITISHKMMYAGKFEEKDIRRVKSHFNESLQLLNIDDLIKGDIYQNKKINKLLKWRIRYRISGYSSFKSPLWLLIILKNTLRSKIKPYRNSVLIIQINITNNALVGDISKDLIHIYQKSGDKILPKISRLNINFVNLFQRRFFHFFSTYAWKSHLCFFINSKDGSESKNQIFNNIIYLDKNFNVKEIKEEIFNSIDKLIISKNFKTSSIID